MLRRTPLIAFLDPSLVGGGLEEDRHLAQKSLWAVAENVTFFGGKVKRRKGPGLFRDSGLGTSCRGIAQHQLSSGIRTVWSSWLGNTVRWDGVTQTALHNFASSGQFQEHQTALRDASYIDFTSYGNWMILNSGIGPAMIDKNGVVSVYAGPSDVVTFMKKLSFVLAIGHEAAGTQVSWSAADNIEEWTAAANNEAGSLAMEDFDTRIKAAARLGQGIAVYGEDQVGLVSFVNSPFYFGQKMLLDGIGAVGKAAVVSDGANNFGVGRNGIWWTDGLSYRYIDEGKLRDYLQENVNWAQRSKIVAVRDDITNCFEFYFPTGLSSEITEGWSFDPRNAAWSKVPAVRYKAERKLFDWPLQGNGTGVLQYSQQDAAVAAPLSLRTKPMSVQLQAPHGMFDLHNDVKVHEIELLLKEASNVEVRYGVSTEIEAEPKWDAWTALNVGARTRKVQAGTPSGVYHTLEFRSTAANWAFNLQGFLLFGMLEGTKRA